MATLQRALSGSMAQPSMAGVEPVEQQSSFFSLTVAALVTKQWISAVHKETKEKFITLDEVSWHDHSGDCWVIIYDRVYDLTDFLDKHPGGADILLECAGRDASVAFRGSGHSKAAMKAMERYRIGELPPNQRIYRKPGGIKLSNLPE